jgi:hypothetical protein
MGRPSIHFQGRNPIGARLALKAPFDRPSQVREIVGVARQTRGEPDAPEELLQVYVPLAQFPTGDVYMVVQPSAGSAEALTPLVRRVVARIDPDAPVRRDRTLEMLSIQSTAGYRFRATIVGAFAALALVLAMVGVFGVLAYTVQQRQREIGVRMALGATSARVVWLVFREAGWMIATGAVAGVVLAAFSGRLVAAFLFGVDPLDPLTFVSVSVLILITASVAAAAPARRATRLDPPRRRSFLPFSPDPPRNSSPTGTAPERRRCSGTGSNAGPDRPGNRRLQGSSTRRLLYDAGMMSCPPPPIAITPNSLPNHFFARGVTVAG